MWMKGGRLGCGLVKRGEVGSWERKLRDGSAFPSGAGAMRLGLGVRDHRRGLESQLSSAEGGRATWAWSRGLTPPPPPPCPHPCAPCRRPSGIPEKDLRSAMAPYLLQQRDALQRRVQRQEAENRQLADAVLAGRRQLEELQLQAQARQQAWQVSAPARPSGPPSPVAAEEKMGPERAGGVPRGGFSLSRSGQHSIAMAAQLHVTTARHL